MSKRVRPRLARLPCSSPTRGGGHSTARASGPFSRDAHRAAGRWACPANAQRRHDGIRPVQRRPVITDRRPLCLAITTAAHLGTRACATRLIRPLRGIWTSPAARCSCDGARVAAVARSEWTVGHGPSSSRGHKSALAFQSAHAVRDPRAHRRAALGSLRRAETTQTGRRDCRRETPVCAPPAPPRPRGRDGPMKVSRWSSSSASSGTPTAGSPRSTYKASTAPRSSRPCIPDRGR